MSGVFSIDPCRNQSAPFFLLPRFIVTHIDHLIGHRIDHSHSDTYTGWCELIGIYTFNKVLMPGGHQFVLLFFELYDFLDLSFIQFEHHSPFPIMWRKGEDLNPILSDNPLSRRFRHPERLPFLPQNTKSSNHCTVNSNSNSSATYHAMIAAFITTLLDMAENTGFEPVWVLPRMV
jgi:hypothetical protein